MCGVEIHGLVCDGGGSNESFLHKIVKKLGFDKNDKSPICEYDSSI